MAQRCYAAVLWPSAPQGKKHSRGASFMTEKSSETEHRRMHSCSCYSAFEICECINAFSFRTRSYRKLLFFTRPYTAGAFLWSPNLVDSTLSIFSKHRVRFIHCPSFSLNNGDCKRIVT